MPNTYIDPVCGLELTSTNVGATWDLDGETYYFCSLDCKETFMRDPEGFLLDRMEDQDEEQPR